MDVTYFREPFSADLDVVAILTACHFKSFILEMENVFAGFCVSIGVSQSHPPRLLRVISFMPTKTASR